MQIAYENAPQIKEKYKLENASFIKEAIDENAIQIEVGDKLSDKFKPEMTIRKWDDEVNFKIKYRHNEKEKDLKFELDGEKIKLKGKKIETHFYEVGENYEFEIILLEKPISNIIEFDIETQGLNLYYQPILTIENNPDADYCIDTACFKTIDGQTATTTHRPENIVGSYAVYHESKTNNVLYPIDKSKYTQEELNQMVLDKTHIGKINNETDEIDYFKVGKKYRAGKAFHIPKPQMEDNNGWKVWGILNIENGLLTVEIPQEFLDNAVYPVRHAAGLTFGWTSQGGTTTSGTLENYIIGGLYTGVEGNGVSITAFITGNGNGANYKMALYDNAGATKNLIENSVTNEGVYDGTGNINGYTQNFVSTPTLSAMDYVIVVWSSSVSGDIRLSYDTDAEHTEYYKSQAYNSFPSAISGWSDTGRRMAIYCTYTASGAANDWNITDTQHVTTYKQYDNVNCFGSGKLVVYSGGTVVCEKLNCDDIQIFGTGKIVIKDIP